MVCVGGYVHVLERRAGPQVQSLALREHARHDLLHEQLVDAEDVQAKLLHQPLLSGLWRWAGATTATAMTATTTTMHGDGGGDDATHAGAERNREKRNTVNDGTARVIPATDGNNSPYAPRPCGGLGGCAGRRGAAQCRAR
jgi:hypothetical protein